MDTDDSISAIATRLFIMALTGNWSTTFFYCKAGISVTLTRINYHPNFWLFDQ